MEELVDAGLVRFLGVSNFRCGGGRVGGGRSQHAQPSRECRHPSPPPLSLRQLEALLDDARIKPVVNQIELHPLNAQRKLVGVSLRKARALRHLPACLQLPRRHTN